MSRSYLDAASGQPLDSAAREAMLGLADRTWADPTASHHEGRLANQILAAARQTAADVVGVPAANLFFRRAGRDAAEQAIGGLGAGLVLRHPSERVVYLHTAVERAEVIAATASLAQGEQISLEVDPQARVHLGPLRDALQVGADPAVVCVQAANLEVGSTQPLSEVAEICRAAGAGLAVDATGVLGYADIPAGWDALFADASSWAGPRGMAVLALGTGATWRSPGPDSDPTSALDRPLDVDDLAGAVGAAASLDALHRRRTIESARLASLVAQIRDRVPQLVPDVEILGHPDARLPHTVTFSCLYVDGERLATELDRLGFAIGSGSACASRTGLPSHVLAAIGALTHGNVRVSLPIGATAADVEGFLAVLPKAVELVRREAGAPE